MLTPAFSLCFSSGVSYFDSPQTVLCRRFGDGCTNGMMYDPEDPFFFIGITDKTLKSNSCPYLIFFVTETGSVVRLGRGCAEMRPGTHSKALGVLQSLPGRGAGFPGRGRSGETMNLASALIFRVDYG